MSSERNTPDTVANEYYRTCNVLSHRHQGGSPERKNLLAAVDAEDWPAILTMLNADQEIPGMAIPEPLFRGPQSFEDLRELPRSIAEEIHNSIGELKPKTKCDFTFWRDVTFTTMRAGHLVVQDFTQSPKKGRKSGRANDLELVRNFLRNVSGLQPRRGVRSAYVDCLIGRAYHAEWLMREAQEIHALTDEEVELTWELFGIRPALTQLLETYVSRNRYGGNPVVRTAIAVEIAKRMDDFPVLKTGKGIRQQLMAIALELAPREPAVLTAEEVRVVVRNNIKAIHAVRQSK